MGDLVSIVIPFYNDPYVPNAIQSALSQSYPNVEVLVVNDGATAYTELITPYLPRIRYIVKANGGTASALNEGIRQANGRYIAWLSSDDRFYPSKLERQIAFMKARRARISFTSFDRINAAGRVTQRSASARFKSAIHFYERFLSGNPINGCTVVAEKSLLQELGMFDERLLYTHDNDLWLKVLLNRVDFYFLDAPLTQYRMHPGMGTHRFKPAIRQEFARMQARHLPLLRRVIRALKREQGRR
jgi:teichuronic acid biosynthesis glycosyltransferase TuaG